MSVLKVYLADIQHIEPYFFELIKKLPKARQAKINAYYKKEDRLRSLAAGLLIEHIFGNCTVEYNEHKKPYIKGQKGQKHFNLSHSGNYAVLAVCNVPVGIDIEQWKNEEFIKIGKACFHPVEQKYLEENPTSKAFFEIWTLKESYVKMLGAGFSIEPRSFCTIGDKGLSQEKNIRFKLYDDFKNYTIAVCTSSSVEFASTIEQVTFIR